MNERLELAAACRRYLSNYEFPNARKEQIERTMKIMYDILKAHFETPPPLGVSVAETINTEDKNQ